MQKWEIDYVRKCKRNVGIPMIEVDHSDERTGTVETTSSGALIKRMKIDSESFEPLLSNIPLRNHGFLVNSLEKSFSLATSENSDQLIDSSANLCSSSSSDHVLAARCSSYDCLRSVDLMAEGFETENSTYMNNMFSRETTPLRELHRDSYEMESTAKKSAASNRRKPPVGKMPSTAEIEEFFSAAENYEQKRFAEKYNYDVVKDVPLEGRYQWVRLKP